MVFGLFWAQPRCSWRNPIVDCVGCVRPSCMETAMNAATALGTFPRDAACFRGVVGAPLYLAAFWLKTHHWGGSDYGHSAGFVWKQTNAVSCLNLTRHTCAPEAAWIGCSNSVLVV